MEVTTGIGGNCSSIECSELDTIDADAVVSVVTVQSQSESSTSGCVCSVFSESVFSLLVLDGLYVSSSSFVARSSLLSSMFFIE